jgi:hypothetical protein
MGARKALAGSGQPEALAWLVVRTAGEFAEKIAREYQDYRFSQVLHDSGLAYIEPRHGAKVVIEALPVVVAG